MLDSRLRGNDGGGEDDGYAPQAALPGYFARCQSGFLVVPESKGITPVLLLPSKPVCE